MTAKAKKTTVETKKKAKRMQGVVMAANSAKTLQVRVEIKFRHPLFGKIIKTHKKYQVHCEAEGIVVGDKVTIEEGKPASKSKRFYFVEKLA